MKDEKKAAILIRWHNTKTVVLLVSLVLNVLAYKGYTLNPPVSPQERADVAYQDKNSTWGRLMAQAEEGPKMGKQHGSNNPSR